MKHMASTHETSNWNISKKYIQLLEYAIPLSSSSSSSSQKFRVAIFREPESHIIDPLVSNDREKYLK